MAKRILVIDDAEELRELYQHILEDEGYEVAALGYKKKMMGSVKHHKPDLIICDYLFDLEPHGWTLVQKLKLDRDTADLPIIMCTGARKELEAIEDELQEKNVAVLHKPFDIDELLTLVASRLEQAQPAAGGG
jgi:two-component system, OmpR family, phosphate regulon response regulator PhoB